MRSPRQGGVLGECVWWALVGAGAVYGALRLPGAAGAAAATAGAIVAPLVHALLRAKQARVPAWVLGLWYLAVLPALAGVLIAAWPTAFAYVFVPFCAVGWFGTRLPARLRVRGRTLPARAAGVAVVLATLCTCAALPVKWLDGRVGPATYRGLTPAQLCERLGHDQGIACEVVWLDVDEGVVDFTIPRTMTRREVLEKLAKDTGLDVQLGGCATGGSLLWGTGPGTVHLSSRPRP